MEREPTVQPQEPAIEHAHRERTTAAAAWFANQLRAAEASGRCAREQWTPWDPRRLARLADQLGGGG